MNIIMIFLLASAALLSTPPVAVEARTSTAAKSSTRVDAYDSRRIRDQFSSNKRIVEKGVNKNNILESIYNNRQKSMVQQLFQPILRNEEGSLPIIDEPLKHKWQSLNEDVEFLLADDGIVNSHVIKR